MTKHLLQLAALWLSAVLPLNALAQPANDNCSGAIELFPDAACTPVAGTVTGATQSIPGTVLCDGFNATPDDDVWYRFTATLTSHIIRVQGSANFDAVIQLLSDACDGTPVDCQDMVSQGGLESLVANGLTVGQEYLIRVFHWAATPPATPTFTICVTGVYPPPNDDCANAIELLPSPSCNPIAGTTESASASIPGLVTCSGFNGNPNDDVWYSFVATSTDHTVNVTPSSGFDPVVQLRDGSAGCNGSPIICLAEGSTGQAVSLDFTGLTVGNTYFLRVFHYAATNPTTPTFSICLIGPAPPCTADASTLTPNRPEVCFEDGPTMIDAALDALPVVPDGYEVLHLLTTGPGLTIVDTASTPVFFVDALGTYTIHTLVHDTATLDLSGLVLGVTEAGEILSQLIQGGGEICGSLDVNGAVVDVIECAECEAEAGTITADFESVCLDNGMATVSATPNGDAVVPDGFELIHVLTQGAGLVIIDASVTPEFMVLAAGEYRIHTLVYDPATLDLGIVVPGTTTGFDVLQYIMDNELCASLDASGALVMVEECPVCEADAGTITADENPVCFDTGLNEAMISATPNGNAVVPTGFETLYVLTQGVGLLVIDADVTSAFTVFATGDYTIHTLVYDPGTFNLGTIEFGVTTGQDVLDYIANNGLCASLDAVGAPITVQNCTVCDASAGTLIIDASPVCLFMGTAQVGASHVTQPVEPDGYATAYALTQGPGLVIVAINLGPVFTISQPGDYTVHTLVFDPNTIDPGLIELGVTTGFDINALLIQGGGSICGALDVAGASVTVEDCSPANDDCINAAPLAINAEDDCPANAVAGDNGYADADGGVPSCDQAGSYLFDVWYTFNAGENTEVTLALDPGTMQDWAIAIYDACGGNELGCHLNPAAPITLSTAAFTDYVVQVYSNFTNGNGGAFTICVTGAVPSVVCDGGLVQTTGGSFSVDVCQDLEADVIDFTSNSNSNEEYSYVLTDDNDVIITVLASGSLDFNSAPLGTYRVWGISHNGDLVGADPGELATAITSTGTCIALSNNYVIVNVEICDGISSATGTGWSLFPNPGNGDFSLLSPADGLASVDLIDLSGRTVRTERVNMVKGLPHPMALAGQLAPGAYTVRVASQGQAATLGLVVR